MTQTLLELIPHYGIWLVFGATFLSCMALPIPASLVMLVAGGFAASGDLALAPVMTMALAGAVCGDQAGYQVGRCGGVILRRISANPVRAAMIDKASMMIRARGIISVFLSRWLFSPLGPWVNFAAGAAGMPWARFTAAGVAGEGVWVLAYVGLGFAFADKVVELSELLGQASGLLAALLVVVLLGLWLRSAMRHPAASAAMAA